MRRLIGANDPQTLQASKQPGIARGVACRRVEQGLALFPYLRARL